LLLGAAGGDLVDQLRDVLLVDAFLRFEEALSAPAFYLYHGKHDLAELHALPLLLPQQQDHPVDLVAHLQHPPMQLPVPLHECLQLLVGSLLDFVALAQPTHYLPQPALPFLKGLAHCAEVVLKSMQYLLDALVLLPVYA